MTRPLAQAVAIVAAAAIVGAAQSPPPVELLLEQELSWLARGNDQRRFVVPAAAGDLVRIVVGSDGGDEIVEIAELDGTGARLFNRWGRDRGLPEEAAWIAADARPRQVTVRLTGAVDGREGFVRVRLAARAPATDDDRAVLGIEALEQEAESARQSRTAESRERAAALFERAAGAWTSRGDLLRAARAWFDRGNVLNALGRAAEAMVPFERAVDAARGRAGAVELAEMVNQLAISFRLSGDRVRARALYEEALGLFRDADHQIGQARTLHNLGTAWFSEGDFVAARARYDEAYALRLSLGDEAATGETLIALGATYRNLGDVQAALQAYADAIVRKRAGKDREGEARALANLGTAYAALGDPERALEVFQQSLAITRVTGDIRWQATALSGSGRAALALGDLALASRYIEEQLLLVRRTGVVPEIGRALLDVGRLRLALGQAAGAAPHLEEAERVFVEVGDRVFVEETVRRRAEAALAAGDVDSAAQLVARATALSDELGLQGAQADAAALGARIARRQGRLDEALAQARRAITLHERQRRAVTSPERQAGLRDSVDEFYKLEVAILMALNAVEPSAGHAEAALVASERGRAEVLQQVLREAQMGERRARTEDARSAQPGDAPSARPEALAARDAALRRALDEKETQRLALLRTRYSPAARVAIERDITALDAEFEAVQAERRRLDPRYAAVTAAAPASLADLRRALPPDGLAVHYSLGLAASIAWVVAPDRVTAVTLGDGGAIDAAGERLLAVLRQGARREVQAAIRQAAAELAALVVDPLLPHLRRTRLVVVTDGVLNLVPLAMLPDRANGGQPLLERFEIALAPSLGTSGVLAQAGPSRAPRTALVVTDPVYSADDPRVGKRSARDASPGAGLGASGVSDDLRRSANESGVALLERLPQTAVEATAVVQAASAGAVDVVSGVSATRTLLLSERPAAYRIVHIAAHGLVNASRPSASGVVLSLVGADGVAQDGFLRLRDVHTMQLDADLVVLSACRTAVGRRADGEGLLGLSRAFMFAGARSVVASLWDVRDAGTAQLMSLFYRQLLGTGVSPAAALRQAQRRLRTDPAYSSPYHWSGFVVQGDAHRAWGRP